MKCEDVRLIESGEVIDGDLLPEVSALPQVEALSERYAARGLHRSVLNDAARQIEKEEETRAMVPDAYRMSALTDGAVRGQYRRGKEEMDSTDLIRYFSETRTRRIRGVDFSEDQTHHTEESENAMMKVEEHGIEPVGLKSRLRMLPAMVASRVKDSFPNWFNGDAPDTSRNSHRFPLSAFAAILAIAASMMLIVASSVMLTRAENDLNRLKREASSLSGEVADLKSDFEVRIDLLEIRRIAMEEYGMVDEDYLRMQYLTMSSEDSVEVYEEEREESVGLSAILSAIGIK